MPLTEIEQKELDSLNSELTSRQDEEGLAPAGVELEIEALSAELLKREGEDPNTPAPVVTDEEQFKTDEQLMKLAEDKEMQSFDFVDLNRYNEELTRDPDIIKGDKGIDRHGFIDTFKEMKNLDEIAKRIPVVSSVFKSARIVELMQSVEILNGNKKTIGDRSHRHIPGAFVSQRPVTEKDKKDAQRFVNMWMADMEVAQNRTAGGKFADVALELPGFIIEFMATGPVFKTGNAAAQKTATKLLGNYADNVVGKVATRVAGLGFGSLARTGVNMPRVLAGALEESVKGGVSITEDGALVFADAERNPFTALSRSFTSLFIENLSEVSGKSLGEAATFIGKGIGKQFPVIPKFTQGLAEKWMANKAGRTLNQFAKVANTKIGFDGIIQEVGEERLRDVLAVATGLETLDDIAPTWEKMWIEAGILTAFGGVNLAVNKTFRGDPFKNAPTEQNILRPTKGQPLDLSERLANVPLFTSAKNKAIADIEMEQATKFIKDRVAGDPTGFKKLFPKAFKVPKDETDADKALSTVSVFTKSKALDGNAKQAPITEPAGPVKRAIVRNIARAEDAVGTWGKTGIKVQRDLREIAFRTAVNVGNTTQNIKPLVKGLSKAEKITVAQLIDNAISPEGQPQRLKERARQIKKELDVIQNEAIKIGLRQTKLTGRAFPQVLNKEGKALMEAAERDGPKSSMVFAWAQNQVKDGKFKNVDDAIIALQRYREGLISGKTGYIEGTRTLKIGNEFRDWNLDKILSGTIETSWEKIEAGRQWGVLKELKTDAGEVLLPFKDIQIDIAKIRLDVGKNEANALNEYLKAQYGLSKADSALIKVARVARTSQFVGKLAFSPLTITRNILDRYAKGLSHGTFYTNARASIKYPPFMNNWMKSARNIEDQMIRSGAVLGHGHLSEGFTSSEGPLSLIAKPFASSEKGNQTYIALVKKLQLESDVKRLMEVDGPMGPTSKMFDRLATIVGRSQNQTRNRVLTDMTNEQLAETFGQGEISDDVMSEVLHRTVTDSAFPLTLASKRLWWNQKPVLQAATQFKVWSADQTRFIYKDVLKYSIQTGDYSRLARFIVSTWLVGELYNISRDELLNKDESVLSKIQGGTREEILMAIGKDLVDGGVVGMIADFTYGIGDWAAGPTTNSLSGMATAIDQARGTATLPEAVGRFLLQDAPALRQAQGVIDNLDSIFDENNLTENYSRWQGRSFDFRRKQGDSASDIIGNRFMRSLRGTPQKKVTERSLSLNMVARQVLVGDYDDAAQHIKRVMRDTEVDKIDSAISSFKQSMRNNSPFGNIRQDKIGLFLAQFSPEEAVIGLELQEKWIKGYSKSLEIAFKELKSEGFEEGLEAKKEAYEKEMKPIIEEARKKLKEIKSLRQKK